MPRTKTKHQKRALINNQTNRKLRIYYKGAAVLKLKVIILLFPEESPRLASFHQEATLEPKRFLPIPLTGDWKTFNGFLCDTSRVKQICLKVEQTNYPESNEYVLRINELVN